MSELARIVEALLFLSGDPVSTEDLAQAAAVDPSVVESALAELQLAYRSGERGLIIREVGGGYMLASDPVAEDAARALLAKPRYASLTPAQLETLAIVAYLQPVSRPEIARIRGVNTDSPVATLLDRGLLTEEGRSQFGAVLYATTPLFLRLFGLQGVGELPEIEQWDASDEERVALRERLLAAGEARAGVGAATPPEGGLP
jgi:segregation and condensation protein B